MIELVRKRRSIRSFTGKAVEREKLDLLVETLLRSPSSRNINPWEFVVVDQPALLESLSAAKEHGSAFLRGAAIGIVVCADETRSDVWVEDCAIASIMVQMVAQSLGLGSCWIQIRQRRHDRNRTAEDYIRDLLGLPEQIRVESMIGIGYPGESRRGLAASRLQYDKVRYNHYDRPWFETK